jgi:large subunit ribosomal protein L6
MSRIGQKPITIPAGVTVQLKEQAVTVTGPKGTLTLTAHPRALLSIEGTELHVKRGSETHDDKSIHGLTRTLISNMVDGVTKGFEKKLEIQGVGYRGQMKGATLSLNVGFSHPVDIVPPAGITLGIQESIITINGADKATVGQVAAQIRGVKKPEPYKGKGIRYLGEIVRRKEGKKASS